MERRAFLAASGQTAMLAMAAGVAKAARLGQSEEPATLSTVEQRVAGVIEAYDAQGNHRTGTAVDRQSGEWLATQMRAMGVEPVFEPFTLNRIDVRTCYVRIDDRRIDAVLSSGSAADFLPSRATVRCTTTPRIAGLNPSTCRI